MAKFTNLRIISVCGGDPIEAQFEALSERPDIIIATPGRLMHHIREISTFKLKHVQYLVFDEADRLFEMGFAEQLNEIIRECPTERQTLLFSATMPQQLVQFSRAGLRDPQLIRLDTDTKMSEELRLAFLCVRSNEKVAALLYIVRQVIPANQLTIIFTATKHHSEFIHALFQCVGLKSTLVYGSMDQDARSLNLKAFRNGDVNFMVVTDLAARGIDVPLLNNVINFHFPPSPKLFVHRCGRAARQGRVGFAFSIVEPDEMAYMVDVHTFLGKRVETGYPDDGELSSLTSVAYTLSSMRPSMVHTGIFPQDVIAEEMDSAGRLMTESEELQILWRICENGMKQYRRTRTEATRSGIKIAKTLAKQDVIRTIHPLIAGMDPDRCSSNVLQKASFIRHLQSFRPAQTVFESGIGTGTAGAKTGSKNGKGGTDSFGVEIMRALRKEVAPALERAQKHSETDPSSECNEGSDNFSSGDASDAEVDIGSDDDYGASVTDEYVDEKEHIAKRPRLSRADRKRLKKQGNKVERSPATNGNDGDDPLCTISGDKASKKRGYADERFYMSYGNEDEVATYIEDTLQPQSGLKSAESLGAQMLENAMLDVAPDDAMEMNRKKKMLRWDAKKRKFVKQTLEEMSQSKSGVKKVRTESGVVLSKSAKPQGEMYNTWKKKTKREVSLAGTGDDDDDTYNRPKPNFRFNRKVPDEIRNAHQIRKIQNKRSDMKLKNMKKEKRKSIEGNNRKKKSEQAKNAFSGPKAGNRKVKVIVRR
eukprot:CAMPEP_0185030076 /NCGR_PEP_ID=MMETSP1103-20130426/16815_1 /TAXON_ID=36769 /ORGANISM="Paraphysomonas bandaiensis, Strain Caron Lab Isolate" /LENGTH=762 /DNA_ID=CAMNT_0027565051 /DNA_START=427 /DNA_END=2715 /DNA_ORIENTATION=+